MSATWRRRSTFRTTRASIPTDVTQALAKGARAGGARIFENTPVTGILTAITAASRACAPSAATIRAEIVVNCAGMWAREVGRMAGVNVPLQAAEHYYLISEPVPGVHPLLPILRDPGNSAYIREEAGKIMVGLFEAGRRPWGRSGIPEDFRFGEIPPDWERMYPHIEKAMRRVPACSTPASSCCSAGPSRSPPDHNYLMGEAPNLKNFFVAAGFNSLGILSGGGVGFVMAHWITDGHAPMDVWSVNIRRMHAWQNNDRYLLDRIGRDRSASAIRTIGRFASGQTARGVKKSILHDRLAAAGACFGESAGWERPNWYARPGTSALLRVRLGPAELVLQQRRGARGGTRARGPVRAVLVCEADGAGPRRGERAQSHRHRQRRCGASGACVYTQFLNAARRHRGGSDRDAPGAGSLPGGDRGVHADACRSWIRNSHLRRCASARVTDVSDAYAMLNLQGPASRALLQAIVDRRFLRRRLSVCQLPRDRIGYQSAWRCA